MEGIKASQNKVRNFRIVLLSVAIEKGHIFHTKDIKSRDKSATIFKLVKRGV